MGLRSFVSRGFLACAATLLLGGAASAIPIAVWDIGSATGAGASVLLTEPGVTATDLISVGVDPWTFGQDGFVAAADWAPGLAPDPGKYFEWSSTAAVGTAIDYDSLSLALLRGIQGANHGAELWDLHASVDGFAGSDVYLGTLDLSGSAADEQIIFNVDLSSLGVLAGTVTFRLYGYDYTSPADYSGLGNDSGWVIGGTGVDLGIDGSVVVLPVPEPGSLLLVGLALVLLATPLRRAAQAPPEARSKRAR